uniref:Uncharacterized protein n=1 Tax=Arundo donax TaxID=35708 RepID=A0A0A8ZRT6_ARUDO
MPRAPPPRRCRCGTACERCGSGQCRLLRCQGAASAHDAARGGRGELRGV